MISETVYIVQARMNSTRVFNKMTRPILGPSGLFTLTLKKVLDSNIPKKDFYASVYEKELKTITQQYGLQIYERSEKSANETKDVNTILEWGNYFLDIGYKNYIMISACCPFLKPSTIDSFIDQYKQSGLPGLFSVVKEKNLFWVSNKKPFSTKYDSFQTQQMNHIYKGAHCLYAGSLERLVNQGIHVGTFQEIDDPGIFEMNSFESFDIDEEWQFQFAKSYLSNL